MNEFGLEDFEKDRKYYNSLDTDQKIEHIKDRIEDSKETIRVEKNRLHLRKTILKLLKEKKRGKK